jgi:hypothetical protein
MTETYTFKKEGNFLVTEVLGLKFGFRKWTWGEKNTLSVQCSSLNQITGEVNFDSARFNTGLIEKTVYKFENDVYKPMTTDEVNNLDGGLGDRLYQITQKINLVQSIETVNL